jgi:DNA helicase-2/ATP-dependent DNA helicase PcrA
MLRQDASLLGYRSNFTVYDEDDSTRLIKHCLEDLRLDTKRFPPRGVRSLISDAKNKLIDIDEFERHSRGSGGDRAEERGCEGARGCRDTSMW